MRWVGWLLAILLCGLWVASEIPRGGTQSGKSPGRCAPEWRKIDAEASVPPAREPSLHPWVVAAEQALLSLLALAAFPARRASQPDQPG
jgi:hypothetical protein